MNELVSTFAERMKELLLYYDIRQIDVANRTGISKATFSQYMSGRMNPKQDKVYQIAQSYGINPSWLMGYDVPMHQEEIKADLMSLEEHALLEAFRNSDDAVKKTILYALKLPRLAEKYESEE